MTNTEVEKKRKPGMLKTLVRKIFGKEKKEKEIIPLEETGKTSKPTLTPEQQKELNEKLLGAVIDNDIEKVRTYLRLGGDKNYKTKEEKTVNLRPFAENSTLLIIASVFRYTDIVNELIENGADVNLQDINGTTALMDAVKNGNFVMCKLLVESGADVNIQERDGWTALFWAAWRGRLGIVKYLISIGANPLINSVSGGIAHKWASTKETIQILKEYTKLWELVGEKNILLIQQSVKNCEPSHVEEIFKNL